MSLYESSVLFGVARHRVSEQVFCSNEPSRCRYGIVEGRFGTAPRYEVGVAFVASVCLVRTRSAPLTVYMQSAVSSTGRPERFTTCTDR